MLRTTSIAVLMAQAVPHSRPPAPQKYSELALRLKAVGTTPMPAPSDASAQAATAWPTHDAHSSPWSLTRGTAVMKALGAAATV